MGTSGYKTIKIIPEVQVRILQPLTVKSNDGRAKENHLFCLFRSVIPGLFYSLGNDQ